MQKNYSSAPFVDRALLKMPAVFALIGGAHQDYRCACNKTKMYKNVFFLQAQKHTESIKQWGGWNKGSFDR